MKRTTIRDVAARADVSVGTVSRVLNQKPVSPATLARVTRAIDALGYAPNAVAQSMRTRTTRAIGLVVNDISNPLFSGIAKAMERDLRQDGFSLLIGNTDNDPERERVVIESLNQRRVDGLAIALSDERDPATVTLLKNIQCPVVLLDRDLALGVDSVCDDHAGGMKKALRYLFDLGHRDIALITGGDSARPGRERARGFREACHERGISPGPDRIRQGSLDSGFGYRQTCELLDNANRPSALIAGGNQILAGVLRALRQFDVRIPHDLSLISCDEIDLTQLMNPPITVITRDIMKSGTLAAELLLRRIAGNAGDEAAHQVIPTELLVRESCTRVD